MVGYPGSEGLVIQVPSNAVYQVNSNYNKNNNDFLVFVVNIRSIFHLSNISWFIIFITNFVTTQIFLLPMFMLIFCSQNTAGNMQQTKITRLEEIPNAN